MIFYSSDLINLGSGSASCSIYLRVMLKNEREDLLFYERWWYDERRSLYILSTYSFSSSKR
jgi:hypothetical protein